MDLPEIANRLYGVRVDCAVVRTRLMRGRDEEVLCLFTDIEDELRRIAEAIGPAAVKEGG